MIASPARQIAGRMREMHALVLAVTADLTEDQLTWQAGSQAPSIRFHLWHLARWADLVQANLPAMSPALAAEIGGGQEIWEREGLAAAWGLAATDLSFRATGMGLADDAAAHLPLPAQADLLDYATRAFAAVDRAVDAVDDELFLVAGRDLLDREASVGTAILNHLLHVSRHLGMIEALRGVQGLRGTATR
jgi:hypothetical protein